MNPIHIDIGGKRVGSGHPVFVIAEAGVNHNGKLDLAKRLVEVAAEAKADAVKFQSFSADRLVTTDARKATYQQHTTDASESQYSMLKRLEFSAEAHRAVCEHARRSGIIFLSTPFDGENANLLAEIGVPAYKVGSGELTNHPFLGILARKGLPIILSTGMATMREVAEALEVIENAGNPQCALLHCVSNYPANVGDTNLLAMRSMEAAFGKIVGYSDHTPGIFIAIAAVALGAKIIEKHFTLDRSLPGPDHLSSLDPEGLKALVEGVRATEAAMGDGFKRPCPAELEVAMVARRSLVAATDIPAGALLSSEMVSIMRPATGIEPKYLEWVIGRRVKRALKKGEALTKNVIE